MSELEGFRAAAARLELAEDRARGEGISTGGHRRMFVFLKLVLFSRQGVAK